MKLADTEMVVVGLVVMALAWVALGGVAGRDMVGW